MYYGVGGTFMLPMIPWTNGLRSIIRWILDNDCRLKHISVMYEISNWIMGTSVLIRIDTEYHYSLLIRWVVSCEMSYLARLLAQAWYGIIHKQRIRFWTRMIICVLNDIIIKETYVIYSFSALNKFIVSTCWNLLIDMVVLFRSITCM